MVQNSSYTCTSWHRIQRLIPPAKRSQGRTIECRTDHRHAESGSVHSPSRRRRRKRVVPRPEWSKPQVIQPLGAGARVVTGHGNRGPRDWSADAAIREKLVLHMGSQATEERLKAVESPRMLHIATHGFFVEESAAVVELAALDQNDGKGWHWTPACTDRDWPFLGLGQQRPKRALSPAILRGKPAS
jgi:hypothetical protein